MCIGAIGGSETCGQGLPTIAGMADKGFIRICLHAVICIISTVNNHLEQTDTLSFSMF